MRMDDLGLPVRGFLDFLLRVWPSVFGSGPDCDCSSGPDRFIDCLDNPDIVQPFKAGRLWLFILQDAIREIGEFGGKLITLRESSSSFFLPNGDLELDSLGIFVRRICAQSALCADNSVAAHVCGSEAAGENRESLIRKTHSHRRHFFDFRKPIIAS